MALSFPFRIDPGTRSAATVPDGSDAEVSEAIAVHVLTNTGERPLRPDFGTESMPFGDGLDQGPLQLQLTEHGWEHITITEITTGEPRDGRIDSIVTWERNN